MFSDIETSRRLSLAPQRAYMCLIQHQGRTIQKENTIRNQCIQKVCNHQTVWTLSFDLEGFQILAFLIYCSVIMCSSQTWIDTGASLKSICHHSRTQHKIPINQIQHMFFGTITRNWKLLSTWGWQIIGIFIYKYLTYFSFGQLRIIIEVSKTAEKNWNSVSTFQSSGIEYFRNIPIF